MRVLFNRSKILLFVCSISFICFFQSISFAQQGILEGSIYDLSTKETIPFANVIKQGTFKGTYSNENGLYSLKLDSGSVQILFSSLSYLDTLVTVSINPNSTTTLDIYLSPDRLLMEEIVVSADRVTKKVQELAVKRNRLNEGLESYTAEIYKLAILGTEAIKDSSDTFQPMAFSERFTNIKHIIKPERFTETIVSNRASKNFFSEYDFFSTGGPPLNLNQDLVPLSILSEDITVPGPISKRTGRFYELTDHPADSSWPEGTIEILVKPRSNNRPLFIGSIWYNEATSTILGIDVTLNDYANTNSGLFSISDLRYQQSYKKIAEFWLPNKTKLSAKLGVISSKRPIFYKDEWSWENYQINPSNLEAADLKLNTSIILPEAHKKSNQYWDSLSSGIDNKNLEYLPKVNTSTSTSKPLEFGMAATSFFFRLPYMLERFYLTNISDIYRFNRVDGHTLGLGMRTPLNSNYEYRVTGGYGFTSDKFNYSFHAHHFIKGFPLSPDINFLNQTTRQYQDYEYNRTPLDFFEFRQTAYNLLFGNVLNNYFNREGAQLGFRLKYDSDSFIRILYLDETHEKQFSNTSYSLFGDPTEKELFPNNDINFSAQNGSLKGLSLHLHHDTRKYIRTQFLRDYNIRDFGWLFDSKLEKGISNWGSDFNYNRYRVGLGLNIPVFSSHFIQSEMILGASDSGTPNQRLFSYNGFVLDDYVRVRPFNTVNFKEPIGYRVSVVKLKYKFGSSITRKAPFQFIQKSGIHIATFLTIGVIDEVASLEPLLPYSKAETQAEIGIVAFKIFGFLYAEFSQRLIGEYGNSVGLTVLF